MANENSKTYDTVLTEVARKRKSAYSLAKTYPAYIILAILIAVSFFIKNFMESNIQQDNNAAFQKAVSSIMSRLERKYFSMEQVLNSMHGLYDNSFVVRDVFELYGSIPAKTYPELKSINYIHRVFQEEIGFFIHQTRSEGYYDIQLHPKIDSDVHYYIEYFVPVEENYHRSGFDFASDPTMTRAIEKSRDENEIIATEVYTSRKPDTVGFYLISSVYIKGEPHTNESERRKNLLGSIALEVDSWLFFERAITPSVASDSTVVFECIDINAQNSRQQVYKSHNYDVMESGYLPLLKDERNLRIADRNMQVNFATVPNFGGELQNYLPLISFIISLLLSAIFFAFILSVTTSRARALDIADRITRSQRRIVESSKDIIAVMDFEGNWKSMNPAAEQIFSTQPREMIGSNIKLLLAEMDDERFINEMLKETDAEKTQRYDFRMKSAENIKWISWSFALSPLDDNIYAIGRDVTIEKIAEQEAELRRKQMELAERHSREASEFKTSFMTKMSHQIRNSLTGIIGYLQLLSAQLYDSEEEKDSYLKFAESSSEELFTFVSDIVEAAASDRGSSLISTIKFGDAIDASKSILKDHPGMNTKIEINVSDESKNAAMVADSELLSDTLFEVFRGMSRGMDKCNFEISAQENSFEGATEIQIMAEGNSMVEKVIDLYKNNKNNLIEALEHDHDDILLNFAIVDSNVRRMSGTLTIETFGNEEGNIVMINLPLQKRTETGS